MKTAKTARNTRNVPPVPGRQTGALAQAAQNSPAAQSLAALQRMADQSPVVQNALALQRMAEDAPQGKFIQRMEDDELQMRPIQRAEAPKTNNTGLPDNLKSGIESLSGMSMDHVKVHRNSDKPAAVQAHAYAQGSDIHLGPGQEKHLPHEAWHVVQQAQGRVKPTMQLKGVDINDDAGLEKEADVMGARAAAMGNVSAPAVQTMRKNAPLILQGQWDLFNNEGIPDTTRKIARSVVYFDPKTAFLDLIKAYGKHDDAHKFIHSAIETDKGLGPLINGYLEETYESDDFFSSSYLIEKIFTIIQDRADTNMPSEEDLWGLDTAQTDDSDHGADVDVVEETIDWADLSEQGLKRLPGGVLFQIFLNLVEHHYKKAGKPLPPVNAFEGVFDKWRDSGVQTRYAFKRMIGLEATSDDNTNTILQLARAGNTYSFNGNYVGPSNGQYYNNVMYYRDGGGNIDFGVNPTNIRLAFNANAGQNIQAAAIKWAQPVKGGSEVQMSNDLADVNKGVMPSGKKVTLRTASRPQHFAIADMLYPNSRKGTWTWHHLTPRYKMILVDMRVHAKHGHNGGVHLW